MYNVLYEPLPRVIFAYALPQNMSDVSAVSFSHYDVIWRQVC